MLRNGTSRPRAIGDAFLVGEEKLGPIPGNRASNSGLNSKLATATFDTGDCPLSGGCAGKYLKFWVVAWIEDESGRLVADYEDHGLRSKPRGNLTSIGQVAVEPISNNVGFWDQEIYICPKDAQCASAAASLPSDALSIDELALSADRADTFETMEVSARLSTGDQGVGGILLLFFDGDPNAGGTIFEIEHVPFVAANSNYLSRVRYQPLVSGPHDIYVVARSGDLVISEMAGLQAFDLLDTTPKCQNPLDNVSDMTGHAGRLGATDRNGSVRVRATLSGIGPVDLDTSVVTIDRLLHEVGGQGELVRSRSDADFLPLTLLAGRGSKADLGRFDTGAGSIPRMRLTLRRLAEDTLQMSLRAHGASLPEVPQLCKGSPRTTTLSTRLLSIDDGVHPVVAAPMTATWRCETDQFGRVYLNAHGSVL